MRSVLSLLVLLLTCATASGQQATLPLERNSRPQSDSVHFYPQDAHDHNIPGAAVLCCTPNDDRSLSCTVLQETPAGMGFGDGAKRFLEGYMRVTAAGFAAYQRAATHSPSRLIWHFNGANGEHVAANAIDANLNCPTVGGPG